FYSDRYMPPDEDTGKELPQPFGEWRANGNQSIIYGKHPDFHMYRVAKMKRPIDCAFEAIIWPTNTYIGKAKSKPDSTHNSACGAHTASPSQPRVATSDFAVWAERFDGDLRTLNPEKLLGEVGIAVTSQDTEKLTFRCPWEKMHSTDNGDK